ncbi:MAG TPA: hypothetical protein VE983_01880 [Solirubrobacteraceae bacterium]|nr:hypothetical protein [Solirubrobacteraceae bacterium]
MSQKRLACGLAAAMVTTLGLAATAGATTGDKLAVTGPYFVAPGQPYTITTSGNAVSPANEVVAWRTTKACKTTYTQEVAAMGTKAPALKASVKGSFKFAKTYTAKPPATTTTYYWCAYLIKGSTQDTYKYADWKWQVPAQGGGPGGP